MTQGKEFAWTSADFDRVQSLIYKRAGISLHDGKHAMVYSRLSRRLRETGHRSFREYLTWLESHDGSEWQEFINCLTTNLTAFFREEHHFHAFADDLKARGVANPRIWCNAASTGEEPYSIAMTVQETLGASTGALAHLLAHLLFGRADGEERVSVDRDGVREETAVVDRAFRQRHALIQAEEVRVLRVAGLDEDDDVRHLAGELGRDLVEGVTHEVLELAVADPHP